MRSFARNGVLLMLSSLLNRIVGSDVKDAASGLAERFAKKVPRERNVRPADVQRAIDELIADARGLKRKHGWGFFKSTRLGDSVRWRLIELGYPQELAQSIAQQLAVSTAYAPEKKSRPQ